MGLLHDIGFKYGTDKATFHKYLDFYEQHLPDRNFRGRLLEIGVMDGLSVRMWREYYPYAEIVGIDTKDNLDALYNDYWKVPKTVKLLQLDGTKAKDVKALGMFDIIIDDGSHKTADQQASYKLLWKQLTPGGVYIIEDLHTSLLPEYVNSKLNTLDWLKTLKKVDITHYSANKKQSMTCIITAEQNDKGKK